MDKLMPGDPSFVGPYRLLGRLGTGGMGRVYVGRAVRGPTVAVKLMHAGLAGAPEFRERFRREVWAGRRVAGNWTAAVVAADTEAAVPWAAMAYSPSLSLHQAVHRYGCLPEHSVWDLAFGLARALQTIHGHDLVHRDLKPSNVLLGLDGPQVIDFGIARTPDGDGPTRTGTVLGTPGFLSPEQISSAPVTGASDVFCLGAVLVFAATGHPAFPDARAGTTAGVLAPLTRPPDLDGTSGPLHALAAACLARDAARRPTPAHIARLASSARPDRARPWLPPEILDHLARVACQLAETTALATAPDGTAPHEAVRHPVPYRPARAHAMPPAVRLAGPACPTAPSLQASWASTPPAVADPPRRARTRRRLLTAAILVLVAVLAPRLLWNADERTEPVRRPTAPAVPTTAGRTEPRSAPAAEAGYQRVQDPLR